MTKHLVGTAALWIFALTSLPAFAWDGQDQSTGDPVEIESGELVRSGSSIQFLDHGTGEYHDAEVQDINRYGNSVEVEVYDNTTGELRTLEMDDE